MEWLTNLLGFANNGSSPFGQLGGSTALTPPQAPAQTQAAAPAAPAANPPAPSGMQMPGLLGKLMGQQGQTGGQNLGTGTNGALLNQAMGLIKGPQMQQPQWMNLLSGPRG